jgi:MFS family permease
VAADSHEGRGASRGGAVPPIGSSGVRRAVEGRLAIRAVRQSASGHDHHPPAVAAGVAVVPFRRYSCYIIAGTRTGARRNNIHVLAATLFLLGVGEELWQAYLPAFIVALGGSAYVVGLFGSCRDLLDSAYQLPGGWISDRFGPRFAIGVFTLTAVGGYAAYATAWSWPMAFAGLAGAMAWKAAAFPATFALIGDTMPAGERIGGFTVQSFAVRIPRVIAAPIGGGLIWYGGVAGGVRTGAAIAVVLGLVALGIQRRAFRTSSSAPRTTARVPMTASLTPALRRLLAAECLVRIGEAIAASFVVLYVTGVLRVSLPVFGMLYALQQIVSLASYVPAAAVARVIGSRTLIGVTFAFFSLFPLALLSAQGPLTLALAFVVGGLKEIGEPARKASIVDLCRPESRGREVAIYYAIRNLLVVPGGIIGGLLWQRSPVLVLGTAGALSAAGLMTFALGFNSRRGTRGPCASTSARDGCRGV